MEIEIGKYYVNKTWKYLLPCLKEYGPVFSTKVSTLYKLAAGIDDGLFMSEKGRCIFLLIDRRYNYKITNNIMTWLKYQPQVIANYPFDNAEGGRKHMFVINIPPRYYHAYEKFMEGKYSKMYSKAEVTTLYKDQPNSPALGVINRTPSAREKFMDNIHNSFAVPYDQIVILPETELDFPIQKKKEIFNYEFINYE